MAATHRSTRSIDELDPTLGEELTSALGRSVAVSLIVREDGGTDVILHDRAGGGAPISDVSKVDLDRVIKAHKRPSRPPVKPDDTPPFPQPEPRALAFPPVAPVTGKSFL